jgi:hypothetical protein
LVVLISTLLKSGFQIVAGTLLKSCAATAPAKSAVTVHALRSTAQFYAAFSQSAKASNEASLPRNPSTSFAAGAPPPGSRIARR